MYYVDSNENVPIGLIFVNFVQQKVTSIGILKLKLGRASMPKSSTPFVYRGAIVACTIWATPITFKTNVGQSHATSNLVSER
jgi:hypothetical protein